MATEDPPQYVVSDVSLDGEDCAELGVLVNGRRFHITCRPTDLRQPGRSCPSRVELEYLALVKEIDDLFEDSDSELSTGEVNPLAQENEKPNADDLHLIPCDGQCSEDRLEAWLLQPFLHHRIFQKFASATSRPLLSTLHDRLYPPTLSFALKLVNGDLTPIQVPNCQQSLDWYSLPSDISMSRYWSECPHTRPESVSPLERSHPQNPNLVMFQGQECWFKPVHAMVPERVYAREIDTLLRIQKAGLSSHIRIPRLKGLVMSAKDGLIYGLLLNAIDNHGTVWNRHNDPIALRKRWYNDVVEMLRQLHAANIAWGDFKPANMLVDEKDDVWLIDFGGGITEGWIDRENMETRRGDLQGLAEFKKFLGLAESSHLFRRTGARGGTLTAISSKRNDAN